MLETGQSSVQSHRVIIVGMFRAIDISDLPKSIVDAIEAMVRNYRERAGGGPPAKRPIGWARDILPELPDSFFEPLPNEVLDLFEGKSA